MSITPIPSLDVEDFKLNAENFDRLSNGTGTYTDRFGNSRLTMDAFMASIGLEVPVAFASGIVVSRSTQTVTYSGNTYRPQVTALPFTTTGTFNSAQWVLVVSNPVDVATHAAASKATPVDADELPVADSAASFGLKKLTWANIKATLKSYFDTQYSAQGNRNRIINGRMQIDQRNGGASQTFTAGAALAYCVDRFYGYCTGANVTGQRTTTANGQNRYRFSGAASNTGIGFGQRIEAINSLDLAGQTATLQTKLSSTSLTTVNWAAYYANTTNSFGTLASPTRTLIASGSFTINSAEATYSTQISVPSAAITGIEIVFTAGALLASQTLTIGDVQLEQGSVALPVEIRQYWQEMELCQRYFEVIDYHIVSMNAILGYDCYTFVPFKVTKRASPSSITGTDISNNGFPAGLPSFAAYANGIRAVKTANGNFPDGYYAFSAAGNSEL